MKYAQRARCTVNLDIISENIGMIKSALADNVKICAVIKADAYGHGAQAVAPYIQDGVDFFAVAAIQEALQLRDAGITKPIMVLGYVWPEDYEELIRQEVRATIFKEEDAVRLAQTALWLGSCAFVHIKADTGMNRIGFRDDDESFEAIGRIMNLEGLEIEGIFTHFAKADEKDQSYTVGQYERFKDFVRRIEEKNYRIPIRHCANSAAAMQQPSMSMDMVRLGIAMYGLYPSENVSRDIALKPAMRITSRVIFVKDVAKGQGISYGHTFVAKDDMRIATIPVGYGDGYPRQLSNKGYVLIRGRRAPIIGRICMDQFMVDVTGIPGVREGDVVTLVGADGGGRIRVEDLSSLCGVFNYEFICGIQPRVPRVYLSGSPISK